MTVLSHWKSASDGTSVQMCPERGLNLLSKPEIYIIKTFQDKIFEDAPSGGHNNGNLVKVEVI